MSLAVYKETKFDVHGKVIDLKPGQLGTTLSELCRQIGGEKFFPRTTVYRALKRFEDFGWLKMEIVVGRQIFTPRSTRGTKPEQHSDLRKTVITVLSLDTCSQQKTSDFSARRTAAEQRRNANEERVDIYKRNDVADSVVSSSSPLQIKNEEKDFEWITEYFESKNHRFTPRAVLRWLKKYESNTIIQTFLLLLEQKKKILKPEAWMETALNGDYARLGKNISANFAFAQTIKLEKNWGSLELLRSYCRDPRDGECIPYSLHPECFQTILTHRLRSIEAGADGLNLHGNLVPA
ncbi:MAG: hypothetical protein V4487_09275 [Chlamydiota bacterium]